ncbi:hypothetical protein B5E58_12960 [Tyzzerella sp. An114]|uniref:hypothetical protein n=1 Tax=Tyzzerella sp. An114 TaxID=1965545 RepID=UPI000B433A9A|nr:hypothetical protein [Tyzzerella sp. An114]OUQ55030.1 hypothetical protein B5E58_12960 [Tyzzerella sp. An114]
MKDLETYEELIYKINNKLSKNLDYQNKIKLDSFLDNSILQGSHSRLHLQIEKVIGEEISLWVKKKKRLNISCWEPNKDLYPQYMLLGTDRGILAYIEFFYHNYQGKIEKDIIEKQAVLYRLSELKERISVVDSDLDRPVFYIHILNYYNYKDIVFETTEMIKDKIFSGNVIIKKENDEDYYFADLREMGSFDELVNIFENLKKNNVKFY